MAGAAASYVAVIGFSFLAYRPDIFACFVLSLQANAEKALKKYAVVSSIALFFSVMLPEVIKNFKLGKGKSVLCSVS
jgi:hypothetical protein